MIWNYTQEELKALFGSVGENVSIHKNVIFFNPQYIHLGSNVRIDAFCVLSASDMGIYIGDYVHVGAGTHFFGSGGRICINDFANISSRVSLFTVNDDYTQGYMTNPLIPSEYKKVQQGNVELRKHSIIGCGSILLPGVTLHEGAAVGALSLVKESVNEFHIVGGVPSKFISNRKNNCLELEQRLKQKI